MGVTQPLIRHHSALQGHSCTCISVWLMVQQTPTCTVLQIQSRMADHMNESWPTRSSKAQRETRRYETRYLSEPIVWLLFFLSFICRDVFFLCVFFSGEKKLCVVRLSFSQMFSKNCHFHIIRKTIVPSFNIIELACCFGPVRWGGILLCSVFLPPSGQQAQRTGEKKKNYLNGYQSIFLSYLCFKNVAQYLKKKKRKKAYLICNVMIILDLKIMHKILLHTTACIVYKLAIASC